MALTLHYQSYAGWKVSMITLHMLAICLAIFRIWVQQRTKGLWWDDYLVIIPTIFDIFFCITLFVYPPMELNTIIMRTTAFGNYWLSLFPSYTVIWLSRISFLIFLTRLFPPRHIYRRVTLSLAGIFVAIYITLLGLSIPLCDGVHIVAPPNPKKACQIPSGINPKILFAFIVDPLSDIVLVVCPLLTLCKVKLSSPGDKTMLLVSLGSSVLTFVLVVTITIFVFGPFTKDVSYDIILYMLGQMAAAVALIASNIPVVACSVYRSVRRRIDENKDNPAAARQPHSSSFKYTEEHLTYDNLTRIPISQFTVCTEL